MSKQIIIMMILSGLTGNIIKLFFDKYIAPMMPEKKKLNSYIKKFFFFILLYALPISAITYLMVTGIAVDKYFVFAMTLNFCVILGNLIFFILNKSLRLHGGHMDMAEMQNTVAKDLATRVEQHDTVLRKIIDQIYPDDKGKHGL